ncbi:MAG TPA: hypothetical protein VFJ81_00560 [Gemmatimonadales bacterium]|nr:hypothetical protein [Gemmatimonadales bacterium]
MKKVALLCLGLALGAANAAEAQLTMQMSNGWSFTFAGNVNAFYIYQNTKDAVTGTTTGKDLSVGTGLLPAFAVFDAKGKEDNLDLGVHFGFAPQVETGGHNASYFGTDAAGAQIDMRQVYLTAGGTWGSLTMGKELGLYQRGNILTDMTLLGVGVGGGGRGTALGRIGYGYLYTDFRPQLTYTTPAGRPTSLSIGLFEGIRQGAFDVLELPRVEAEFNYNGKMGENNNIKLFINGAAQTAKNGVGSGTDNLSSVGGGAGVTIDVSGFALTGSGFYAKGMGILLSGDGIVGGGNFDNGGVDADGTGRKSYGFIGQAVYTPPNSKFGIGGSWGENHLKATDAEGGGQLGKQRAVIGQITYKWSKSLRWVAEYGHIDNYSGDVKTTKADQGSLGMMLFF